MKRIDPFVIFVKAFLVHVGLEVLGGVCGSVFFKVVDGVSEIHAFPIVFSIVIGIIQIIIEASRHEDDKFP